MKLTDFDVFRDLLKEKSGLVVTEDKSYLLESRLHPLLKKWEFNSLSEMALALQAVPDKELVYDIIEAMTTNETSFFRDLHPFQKLQEIVLPYMLKTRINERVLNIWCAAASSGQEPYSIAMMIKDEGAKFSGWKCQITATDISREILARAERGIYSQFEVQRGLPVQLLMKYFTQEEENWTISPEIRKMISYQYFNLLESMAGFGMQDIIFCRNVLIYFDEDDKRIILEKLERQLKPDGFLFLGSAETMINLSESFKPVPDMRGVYAKRDSAHIAKAA